MSRKKKEGKNWATVEKRNSVYIINLGHNSAKVMIPII